ncbi:MAG: sensor histidine kinase [Clostridia bacterium]|nr:sensor histidine kinase [Clostridia bacterium]
MNFLSTIIITVIFYILLGITYTNPIILILTCILDLAMIHGVFKINRFKHGFPFIKNKVKNDYLDIFILAVTTVIISMNFITNFISNFSMRYFIIYFLLFIVVIIIITQKTFVLYHKQKLLSKSVKDYETELQETNQKLQTALAEKQKLVKSNHEFYHRQEALNKKLDDLINNHALDMKTEFGEDYGDILDRINTLSSEYASKMHTISKLSKTKIVEIDDMLSYMQSECSKNNIEFILKIECDVNYILNNFISKSQLETLLGDLIRNAIIAINHSTGDYRSIMVVFGIKDDSYELCICDSGIPFEITTLLNMGLQPASTHESEGGTGIGLLTTFETLESCNASFIINELTNNNYTKSLEIKFDGKKEYTIVSNRSETIKEMNVSKRNIIIKE